MSPVTTDSLRVELGEVRAHNQEQDERLEKLDEWVNGNGKDGAKTTIALLDERLTRIERELRGVIIATWGLAASIFGGVALYFLTVTLPSLIFHVGKP